MSFIIIGNLYDYITHKGIRPFMVSRKINFHYNALKIVSCTYSQKLPGHILPYILIKFHMAMVQLLRNRVVKIARESDTQKEKLWKEILSSVVLHHFMSSLECFQ